MTHGFTPDRPLDAEEQKVVDDAQAAFMAAGHKAEGPFELRYAGDGRCWTSYRGVLTWCPVCDELLDFGEYNAYSEKYPENEMVPIGLVDWKRCEGQVRKCGAPAPDFLAR